jgi:hypothetical protein
LAFEHPLDVRHGPRRTLFALQLADRLKITLDHGRELIIEP